jgi:SPP1 gp7 family putative phage head morphogenesis protein
MCETFGTDDLVALGAAREAADELLAGLRVGLTKALDLSTSRGFDLAAARLAARLRTITAKSDTEALRQALAVLDVDWRATSPSQRSALVRQAMAAAGRATARVSGAIAAPLGRAATEVVEATRGDLRRRHRLAIAADLNALDHRAIQYVTRANTLFVRDAYGRRLDVFGQRVRETVARGLEAGLGRDAIAEDVAELAQSALIRQARSYWDIVAASFVGEARSLSQISSYTEARIDRYILLAVLDEHTTDTCRFLDGKVLETSAAVRTFDRLEASDDPLAIKRERPWVRERVGQDGRRQITVGPNVLAIVERSGVGARDDRGEYARAVSSRELAPAGIGFPPFHGLCRTTTVPDV